VSSLNNRYLKVSIFSLLVLFLSPFMAIAEEPVLERMFVDRDWGGIDQFMENSGEGMDPQEVSLLTNALWSQGRWQDALPYLLQNREFLPEELKPYQDMMIVLALERTGRSDDAFNQAKELLDIAPEELVYYVYYAIARLSSQKGLSPFKWYELMLESAEDRAGRKVALKGMARSGDAKLEHYLALLEMEPLNGPSLEALKNTKRTDIPGVNSAIGYAEYLRGRYEKAIEYLEKVSDPGNRFFRKASYYMAFSFYRLGSYARALEIWSALAGSAGSYEVSSTRRIAYMADKIPDRSISVLERLAREGSEDVVRAARYYLLSFLKDESRKRGEDLFISDFPGHEHATRILWDRGWDNWMKGNVPKALQWWDKAMEHSSDTWEARLLFWRSMAMEKTSRDEEASKLLDRLVTRHPLSIYSLRAFPNGTKPIRDEIPEKLSSDKSLLEEWGFIPYARIRLSRSQEPSELFRAARLADWSGDFLAAFRIGSSLYGNITGGEYLPRKGLELLYPRPYLRKVELLGEKFSVEPYLIWSIMRQESAFDPDATSYVGASGLMQLMPATAEDEAKVLGLGEYDLYDPHTNISLGTCHISRLLRSFLRIDWAVAAYNAGSGSVRRWLRTRSELPFEEWMEEIPYEETAGYVNRVFANLKMYRLIYGE